MDINTKIFGLLLSFSLVISSCGSVKEKDKIAAKAENPLVGSWQLIRYEAIEDGKELWKTNPAHILYQKHITPTHFMWLKYDIDQDQLIGAGGGTYTYNDGVYTENIDFFFPPGANELGQSIPFSVSWEDGNWHHLGYAKQMMLDKDSGTPVREDSSKINEYWARFPEAPKSTSTANVLGSWKLETYREATNTSTMEYPPFVKYLKHVTPTHFIWVKYNGEGDEIFETGSGTYTLSNEKYVETIEMMYPKGSGTVGKKIDFTYSISGDIWDHMGYVNRIDINKPTKPKEDLLIDEKWRLMK